MNKRILAATITAAVIAAAAGSAVASSATSGGTASDYTPINPVRVLDTRNNIGVTKVGPISAGGTVKVTLAGSNGVPADATGATVNVTAVGPTANGYLTVWPDGTQMPATSNVNYGAGGVVANEATVAMTDGAIDIHVNGRGTVSIVVDLVGYYTAAAAAYVPPAATTWNLPAASQGETVNTGGSAVTNSKLLGTVTLAAGTYQVSLSAKATPSMTGAAQVFPAFFVYSQPISASFAGDEVNVGAGALESGGNTNIDSYYSGSGTIVVPSGGETLSLYAFGYDSDRGAGTYVLDTASLTAVPLS